MPLKKWRPPPPTSGPEKEEGGSIVFVGNFNPAIFEPLWFAKQGILPDREAESAEIQIVHREVTSFSLEWLGLQVTQDRFTASTPDSAHLEPLRDFVLSTFSVLEHTPLRLMGMNRDIHYRLASPAVLAAAGSHIVLSSFWEHIISDSRFESVRVSGRRREIEDALLRLRVEPSVRLVPGLYFGFNEHYEAEGDDRTRQLLSVLDERWRNYQVWAKETADYIILDLTRERH